MSCRCQVIPDWFRSVFCRIVSLVRNESAHSKISNFNCQRRFARNKHISCRQVSVNNFFLCQKFHSIRNLKTTIVRKSKYAYHDTLSVRSNSPHARISNKLPNSQNSITRKSCFCLFWCHPKYVTTFGCRNFCKIKASFFTSDEEQSFNCLHATEEKN